MSILKSVVTAEVLGRTAFGAMAGIMALPFLIALATPPQLGPMLWRIGGDYLTLDVAAATVCLAVATLLTFFLRLPHKHLL